MHQRDSCLLRLGVSANQLVTAGQPPASLTQVTAAAAAPHAPPLPLRAEDLGSASFCKLCRECDLMDRRFGGGHADVVFTLAKRHKDSHR
jgi:hypothetical protein